MDERDSVDCGEPEGGPEGTLLSADVWMVSRETGPDGWRGTLALEVRGLVFRPKDGGGQRTFSFAEIRRAHRVMGSPVLEVRLAPAATVRLIGFYFIEPPSLDRSNSPGRPMRHRKARKQAVMTLRAWNDVKKDEIRRWVEALREAIAKRDAGD